MEKRKKILLVGSLSNIHLFNYIVNVLSKMNINLVAYHTASLLTIPNEYKDYYNSIGLRIIGGYSIKDVGRIRFVQLAFQGFKSLDSFDYVHLHYVSHYICPIIYLFRRKFKHIILSYWGSDLYRSSMTTRLMTLPLINASSIISFITNDMLDYFRQLSFFYRRNIHKGQILDFGNPFFSNIDNCLNNLPANSNDIVSYFGLEKNKIIIVVGYCGRKEMRQFETIEAIAKMPLHALDKIQLAIPAWGISDTLYRRILTLCDSLKIPYRVYRNFMNPNEVARFRSISDVFIHAQISDALSSAMLENLYAGCIVLNGEWLRYKVFEKEKISYVTFRDFKDLSKQLETVLSNYEEFRAISQKNREKVYLIASWNIWQEKWLNLYKM